ncbi:MAG: tellurite resistance protein TerC [Acidobacteriota bacterium]|jgi:tellurite resistance protein TerC|nr:tellurite resistance protein TerC [Acidobacteriota bacterium]
MDMASHSIWLWVGFGALILTMLSLDLGLFHRKAHTLKYRESLIWSSVWITVAMLFAGAVFWHLGKQKGTEFLAGYLIELSLSVDNLFVFLLVFSFFKVPAKYQHRVLYWGVLGALAMRIVMILLGTALIQRFDWIIYIFGAFLIFTGVRMFSQEETETPPDEKPIVKLVTRYIPISRHYEGKNFFTTENGRRTGTLLLLVLVIVEVTDLMFAVDSIPAIFGVTTDTFIVYTSNVFAIMGLRSLYFLLAGVVEKFHYLKTGLAIVLTFIGVKMLLPLISLGLAYALNRAGATTLAEYAKRGDHISIGIALGIVAIVLVGSVAASLIWPKVAAREIDIDLPPDFDPPFADVKVEKPVTDSETVKHP